MNKISIKESVLMACIIEAIQASLFDDGVSPEQKVSDDERKEAENYLQQNVKRK